MKYVYLKDIEEDYKKVIDLINTDKGDITIYIDSQGGSTHIGAMLIDVINQNADRITLNVIGYCFSEGLEIFLACDKCKRKVHYHSIGMYHLPRRNVETLVNGKLYYDDDKEIMKHDISIKPNMLDFCEKIGMTEDQIKKIDKGKDVWFSSKELLLLINKK